MKLGGKNETYTSLGTTINNMNPYTTKYYQEQQQIYHLYHLSWRILKKTHFHFNHHPITWAVLYFVFSVLLLCSDQRHHWIRVLECSTQEIHVLLTAFYNLYWILTPSWGAKNKKNALSCWSIELTAMSINHLFLSVMWCNVMWFDLTWCDLTWCDVALTVVVLWCRLLIDIREQLQVPAQLPSALPIWKEFMSLLDAVIETTSAQNSHYVLLAPTDFLTSLISQFRVKYANSFSSPPQSWYDP